MTQIRISAGILIFACVRLFLPDPLLLLAAISSLLSLISQCCNYSKDLMQWQQNPADSAEILTFLFLPAIFTLIHKIFDNTCITEHRFQVFLIGYIIQKEGN